MNTASLAMPKAEAYFSMILNNRASIIFGDWCLLQQKTHGDSWDWNQSHFFGILLGILLYHYTMSLDHFVSEAATTRAKLDCLQGTVGWHWFYPHWGSYRLIAVSQAQRYLAAAGKPGGPFGTLGNLPFLSFLNNFMCLSCFFFFFGVIYYSYIIYTHHMIIYVHIHIIYVHIYAYTHIWRNDGGDVLTLTQQDSLTTYPSKTDLISGKCSDTCGRISWEEAML